MTKSIGWRLAVVIAVILSAVVLLIPSFRFYRLTENDRENMPATELSKMRSQSFHLGLDLRGGTHLVLEVDHSKLTEDQRKDATARAMEKIRNRIDEFGVAEPIIQRQGERRIVVQLPGVDAERAKTLVKRTAFLEFRLLEDPVEVQAMIQRMDDAAKFIDMEADSSVVADTGETPESFDADSTLAGLFAEESDTIQTAVPGLDGSSENPVASRIYILENGACSVRMDEEYIIRRYLDEPSIQRVIGHDVEFKWGSKFASQD